MRTVNQIVNLFKSQQHLLPHQSDRNKIISKYMKGIYPAGYYTDKLDVCYISVFFISKLCCRLRKISIKTRLNQAIYTVLLISFCYSDVKRNMILFMVSDVENAKNWRSLHLEHHLTRPCINSKSINFILEIFSSKNWWLNRNYWKRNDTICRDFYARPATVCHQA